MLAFASLFASAEKELFVCHIDCKALNGLLLFYPNASCHLCVYTGFHGFGIVRTAAVRKQISTNFPSAALAFFSWSNRLSMYNTYEYNAIGNENAQFFCYHGLALLTKGNS